MLSFICICQCIPDSYNMVCPPVRGDNPRALAGGLSAVQADKPCNTCNYSLPDLAQYEIFRAKFCDFCQG